MEKYLLGEERTAKQRNLIINTIHDQKRIVGKADNMKDTYGKRTYTCKCGRLTEDYVWQSELAKHKVNCFQCGKELTIDNLKVASAVQVASIRTPTKNR